MDQVNEVTAEHNWVFAGTIEEDGIKCLAVYRSVRTEDGGYPCMNLVDEYLGVYCHLMPAVPELVRDVTMMGGWAIRESYLILDVCPEELVEHKCNALSRTAVIVA